jgi:septin family protein
VIPVIGKSDTLTMAELRDFKQRVSRRALVIGIPR